MRWFVGFCLCLVVWLPFALGQAEMRVNIKLPAIMRLESTETRGADERFGVYSSLTVFTKANWQLLVSADITQPRLYAQLNDQESFSLSELARPMGVKLGGWHTFTLSTRPNQLLQEKASVTYSLVHP